MLRQTEFGLDQVHFVELYTSPPEHALMLCCDEKSQVQALDRTQPGLLMQNGSAATMAYDYKRKGTTTLFARRNVLEGQVISECQKQHTHVEQVKFLKQIDLQTPRDKTLHLVADTCATHKHPNPKAWLEKYPDGIDREGAQARTAADNQVLAGLQQLCRTPVESHRFILLSEVWE